MVSIDLKGLHRVQSHGRTYYYAWRGGPRLPGEPGTPEFVEALHNAHQARKQGDKSRLEGLCAAYRASDEWRELSVKTRANWSPWLDRIQATFGELRIAQFDRPEIRPVIRKWRDKYRNTARAADMALQVFSRLLSYGVAEGKLQVNACAGIPRLYRNDRAAVIWTDEDLAALAKHASAPVMRAARLAVMTGLRQGDLLRLAWSHVKPNSIEIATGKSSKRKTTLIPMHDALRDLLDEIRAETAKEARARLAAAGGRIGPAAATVLTNSDGLPWRTGFGSSWQKAIAKAGIDKHFHDLRGTAATQLYLADFSIREIAEVMTWSEDQVTNLVNMYVKRDELLRDRIRRLNNAAAERAASKKAERGE